MGRDSHGRGRSLNRSLSAAEAVKGSGGRGPVRNSTTQWLPALWALVDWGTVRV